MSLDVTHQALIKRAWLQRLGALGTRAGEAFVGLLSFYERYDEEKYGSDVVRCTTRRRSPGCSARSCSAARNLNVEIETTPGLCFGQTVVDRWSVTGRQRKRDLGHPCRRRRLLRTDSRRVPPLP